MERCWHVPIILPVDILSLQKRRKSNTVMKSVLSAVLKLAVRHGKYGKFIACSNYPECRYVKSKEKKKVDDTGEVSKLGSKMVWRNGRYGKFEACSNFPSCKYIKK